MVVRGHTQNGTVVLDEQVDLPDGVEVEIVLPEPSASGLCGIWEDARSAQEIAEEITALRTEGRKVTL